MEKVEARARNRSTSARASEGDIVIENGEFKVTGTANRSRCDGRARSLHGAQSARRHGAGLKETAFYDPTNSPSRRRLYLRARGRCRHRQNVFRQFRRADDFGRLINPNDRRRPGPWRSCPGIGASPSRGRGFMTARVNSYRVVHGLHHAARGRPAVIKLNHTTTAVPRQSARVKGCGEAGASAFPLPSSTAHHRRDRPQTSSRCRRPRPGGWHAIHGSAQ